jgi:hypothetical protein
MIGKQGWTLILAVLSVSIIAIAPALARAPHSESGRPHDDVGGFPPGPRDPNAMADPNAPARHIPNGPPGSMRPVHAASVLMQLVYPCLADCSATAGTCNDSADSTALTCISDACGTEVETAQTTCAADRTSQECQDATSALRTCGQSCLETRKTAITACRDELEACRTTCDAAD